MKRNVLFCAQRRVLQGMLIGGAALSLGAQAQEAGTPPAETQATDKKIAELDSVMVTAQRRAERLQDVPISITAIGSEELALRHVNDLKSLSATVPGLLIAKAVGTNIVALRGVSGMMPVPGASPGVAIYLDGVYLARPESGFFALDDVERIEVLRGPQGTLYGRNSTGGAINIITRDPDDEVRGGFDLSLGNYSSRNFKGSLSAPLGGGFSAGVSAAIEGRDGYFTNPVTGHDLEGRDSYTIRGKLRYASPEGAFDAVLSADEARVKSSSAYQALYSGMSPLNAVYVGLGAPYEVPVDAATESLLRVDVRTSGVGLTMNYAPNENVAFTSVSGYRKFENIAVSDVDGSAGTALRAIGMEPVHISYTDIVPAIKSGEIDGMLGACVVPFWLQLQDHIECVIRVGCPQSEDSWTIMNLETYNSLPEDLRTIVIEEMQQWWAGENRVARVQHAVKFWDDLRERTGKPREVLLSPAEQAWVKQRMETETNAEWIKRQVAGGFKEAEAYLNELIELRDSILASGIPQYPGEPMR
ncbi:MAG: TonB-dependent receptor plug domain-containing protein [Pseudoxanthomonas sp.]